jgi:DNA-directed RNA polymerase specialized sigma24 family protein
MHHVMSVPAGSAWREVQLTMAAADGDPFAWDTLVDRLLPDVWATAVGFGLGEQDTVDVCQVVCVRLAQNLHELAIGGRVAAYVARIADEECRRAGALAVRRDAGPVDLPDAADRHAALAGCVAVAT